MQYCSKCSIIFKTHNRCPLCNNKKIRVPLENDAVFLAYIKDFYDAGMLANMLKENEIPYIKKANTVDFRAISGGFSYGSYDFFVPYGAYEKSKELLIYFNNEDT